MSIGLLPPGPRARRNYGGLMKKVYVSTTTQNRRRVRREIHRRRSPLRAGNEINAEDVLFYGPAHLLQNLHEPKEFCLE